MDMEMFKAQLKELAGKDGEKAWKLVEDWYTGDGNARRLSLHDLHELSQAVVLYADEIRRECAEIAVSSFIANVTRSEIATGNDYAVLVIADHIRADIMGNG